MSGTGRGTVAVPGGFCCFRWYGLRSRLGVTRQRDVAFLATWVRGRFIVDLVVVPLWRRVFGFGGEGCEVVERLVC